MPTIQQRFGKRLKELRQKKRLSQKAVARKAGFTREYVARLEFGRHDLSLSSLTKLAKALKVTVAELVDET